jgi:hypothetical protein
MTSEDTLTPRNINDFLSLKRKRRDEFAETLLKEATEKKSAIGPLESAAIHSALVGDLRPFRSLFNSDSCPTCGTRQDLWTSADHEEFFNICTQIKATEARLYDEAMKAGRG